MQINFWAVLVAAVASMGIGYVWYGPLFGKKFTSAMGMKPMGEWNSEEIAKMKKGMTMKYVWQFVASVVMIYVLAWLMWSLNQVSVMGGLTAAFWVWIGFVVPLKFSDALWIQGKMSLFWLGIGNTLVTLLAAGAIIGAW